MFVMLFIFLFEMKYKNIIFLWIDVVIRRIRYIINFCISLFLGIEKYMNYN